MENHFTYMNNTYVIRIKVYSTESYTVCKNRFCKNIIQYSFETPWPYKYYLNNQNTTTCHFFRRVFLVTKIYIFVGFQVVKMMIVVVTIFGVCWLPFHTYFIVTSYYPDITNFEYIQEIYLAIYWLAMSNSMYNPIIYFWMNSR